ncbi:MAG: Fic family protein [Phycisphaerales bacterium]
MLLGKDLFMGNERKTGVERRIEHGGQAARAFIPHPLPPSDPPLMMDAEMESLHAGALTALARLRVAGSMVPSTDWFLYGFVRKEAVTSSQIEGTQATLRDVVSYEGTERTERPEDVEEVCNYVHALGFAREQLGAPTGLPLGVELLCRTHLVLMTGARGEDKRPGQLRKVQNWIGGAGPGGAYFVPPPADEVAGLLADLEGWLHRDDPLPPLVRAGLAHVQFETIHPFLDGNGRIGRLLIALLIEHWGLLDGPLLYISLAFKRDRMGYYERLTAVRRNGDWGGWTAYFLGCVRDAAEDGVRVARELHGLIGRDRARIIAHERSTVAAIRLLEMLPSQPITTVTAVGEDLAVTPPTARKAVELLETLGILREVSGRQRDRVYSYGEYMRILTGDEGEAEGER